MSNGTILTKQQLYQYATNAGFTGAARDIIVAISQAESGGNTQAYNPNDPYGGSYGVLQINRRSLDVWKLVSTSAVSVIAGYILGYVQHLIK